MQQNYGKWMQPCCGTSTGRQNCAWCSGKRRCAKCLQQNYGNAAALRVVLWEAELREVDCAAELRKLEAAELRDELAAELRDELAAEPREVD